MVISVGQDALGGWAWMLHTRDRKRLIESGHSLLSAEDAVDAASFAWSEAKIRGEPGLSDSPLIFFPDGMPD